MDVFEHQGLAGVSARRAHDAATILVSASPSTLPPSAIHLGVKFATRFHQGFSITSLRLTKRYPKRGTNDDQFSENSSELNKLNSDSLLLSIHAFVAKRAKTGGASIACITAGNKTQGPTSSTVPRAVNRQL